MHTPYSDGSAYHAEIAQAALRAGLDFIIVTDHNSLIQGVEGYYGDENGYTLLLTGEEIHDRLRHPQCNHLLVYGTGKELSHCAGDPQGLIDAVSVLNGLSFLAHPHDQALHRFGEPGIPWENLEVHGYTGLEIWNYMSSAKEAMNGGWRTLLRTAFRPEDVIQSPNPDTLALWDSLLGQGKRVVGIGNSDAHGLVYRLGPLSHTVYPYDFLFSCVNTHILSTQPFLGNLEHDRDIIYRTLRHGSAFIGYDLLGSTRGFRFSANGQAGIAGMGGVLRLGGGVTLQALAKERCTIRLIRHGQIVAEVRGRENLTYTAQQSGAYRVEVWKEYHGLERTWILSNPIYLEDTTYRVSA